MRAALALVALAGLAVAAMAAAATPTVYRGDADRLLPTAAQAGFQTMTDRAGGGARVEASYASGDVRTGAGSVAIAVSKSEAAALARWQAACPGCEVRTSGPWRYKRLFETGVGSPPNRIVSLTARCRNLIIETRREALDNKDHLTKLSRLVIDAIFVRAERLGMTPCGGTPSPAPTRRAYWTETQAEQAVLRLRPSACLIEGENPGCRIERRYFVQAAECRGLDEKAGTFTYSRFTCLVDFSGNLRGRIGVWPTGTTTFRWRLL